MDVRPFPMLDCIHYDYLESMARCAFAKPDVSAELKDDIDAINGWIHVRANCESTFETYRRHSERLLLWCMVRETSLKKLRKSDVRSYLEFLANPTPADFWISEGNAKFERTNAKWRPFYKAASEASQENARGTLSSVFCYLESTGYCENAVPVRDLNYVPRQKVAVSLDANEFNFLLEFVESRPRERPPQEKAYRRNRFIICMLYGGALTLPELTEVRRNDFYLLENENGGKDWWLKVVARDGAVRDVPVPPDLLSELRTYRLSCGLTDLPSPGEEDFLICPVRNTGRKLTYSAMNVAFKALKLGITEYARRVRPSMLPAAERIEAAQAIAIRNSAGRQMADNGIGLRDMAANMGQVPPGCERNYFHSDEARRHRNTLNRAVNWDTKTAHVIDAVPLPLPDTPDF